MQSMLNLHGYYGLPLSVSGFNHHHCSSLYKEMADHDLRREALKKQRSQGGDGDGDHGNQEMGIERNFEIVIEDIQDGEFDEDLASILYDLTCLGLACAAKAA